MYRDDDHHPGQHGLTPQTVYDVAVVASPTNEPGDEKISSVRRKELIVKALEAKQRKLNLICLVLGMTGMFLSIAAAEMLFDNQDEASVAINVVKAVVSATTALLLILLVLRTRALLVLYKHRGGMDIDETLTTSGMLQPLLVELLVCAVHAPPGVSFEIPVYNMGGDVVYTFDAWCSLWHLLRLYLIVSVFNDFVGFRTAQARVIAKWNNVSFDAAFAFKALMERAPLQLLGFVMLMLIFVLGYCLRVLERPLCASWRTLHVMCIDEVELRTDSNSLANMFWFVIITMTTVGYGDMFPLTHGGRAVAVITCLVGVAVIALLVTVITAMSTFRPDEMRAFNALYRNTGRKIFQNSAARMVQACWIYSRGQLYRERLKAGAEPGDAAKAMQGTRPRTNGNRDERRGSAVHKAVRRLSQTIGNNKYSLANGNLHLRHRGRFGKAALLRSLRQWKREKAAYLSLTREKSEVAMVVKEILDVRGRLNEMNEQLEHHAETMSQQDRRMERMEAILESMAVHLKVPLAPAKHLAPLQGTTPAGQSEQKGPGSETRARVLAGGVGSQRGGIGWQWSESGSAPRNAESKLAPIGTTTVRASPSSGGDTNDADGDGDDDDLLVSSMGAGYSPTFGPLTGTMPLALSQSGSRRNANSNSVVPLGRIGALNADASGADATHE